MPQWLQASQVGWAHSELAGIAWALVCRKRTPACVTEFHDDASDNCTLYAVQSVRQAAIMLSPPMFEPYKHTIQSHHAASDLHVQCPAMVCITNECGTCVQHNKHSSCRNRQLPHALTLEVRHTADQSQVCGEL
jgi:hypothetical protein